MAKLSSNKRPVQTKKEAGCMWGLINFFDFRQGQRTLRLLSDKKSEGSSSRDTGNGDFRISLGSLDSTLKVNNADIDDDGMLEKVNLSSVKTLMEQEMSQLTTQKNSSNDNGQQVTSETGFEVQVKKNNINRSKKPKVISDALDSNLTSPAGRKNHQCGSSIGSNALSTDLAAFLVQFYSHGYQLHQTHSDSDNVDYACPTSEVTSEKLNNQLDEPDSLLNEKQAILKKALADLTHMISNQSHDEKMSYGFTQSKEFLDVLNTLNSNKESFLRILEHPDSPFLKQFQDFQDGQVAKYSKVNSIKYPEKIGLSGKDVGSGKFEEPVGEPLHKQSRYRFFWKQRSKATVPSQGSPSPLAQNRIVVLKPNPDKIIRSALKASISPSQLPRKMKPEENVEKAMPFFSLKEMKRRIRNIFGESKKAHHAISMDGILHKIPIGSKDSVDTDKLIAHKRVSISSARKSSVDPKVPFDAMTILNEKDKQLSLQESDPNIVSGLPLPVVGNGIYEAGRKHLAEILNIGDVRDNVATARTSKPLGRILSLPEYSAIFSEPSSESEYELKLSHKDRKLIAPKQNYREDGHRSYNSGKQNLEAEFLSSSILHHELQMTDLKVELFESKPDIASIRLNADHEGPSAPDNFDITVVNKLDAISSSNVYQGNAASEICVKEEECTQLKDNLVYAASEIFVKEPSQGLIELHTGILSESATSSSPSESIMSPVASIGKLGRKTPASVVEKFYSDDATGPEWMSVKHSRRQLKPRQLSFEDDVLPKTSPFLDMEEHSKTRDNKQARLSYIKAVLQVSELSGNEHSNKWYWADQLLDPFLFEKVEASSYELQDDPKLLFDCLNEVLSEIQERHYKMAFITQYVGLAPVGVNLIKEVSKEVDLCLRTASPNTVDQIMKRDMDSETWMNLRLEVEDMVIDIWDTLLDDLMEESVFDFWLIDM